MKKVLIDMDQQFVWWIPSEHDLAATSDKVPSIEMDEEWLAEYKTVTQRFAEMQLELERHYRQQEGLSPLSM